MTLEATSKSRGVFPLEIDRGDRDAGIAARTRASGQVDGHCVTLVDPESYEAGQYLRLRYCLEALRPSGMGMIVGICSPAAGDGKTLTAINIAGALAQKKDTRVLLVDVDIRRRSEVLRSLIPMDGEFAPGLVELLMRGRRNVEEAVQRVEQSNIWVLPTGSFPVSPYEAFASERFAGLLEGARSKFDYVVVDAPPVVAVPDCKVLADTVDGFVMVVAANGTPKIMLTQALEIMGPDKLIGLIMNRCDQLPRRYYRYYGHYGYAARATGRSAGHVVAPPGEFVYTNNNGSGSDTHGRS